jgi:hypothetical protein
MFVIGLSYETIIDIYVLRNIFFIRILLIPFFIYFFGFNELIKSFSKNNIYILSFNDAEKSIYDVIPLPNQE